MKKLDLYEKEYSSATKMLGKLRTDYSNRRLGVAKELNSKVREFNQC